MDVPPKLALLCSLCFVACAGGVIEGRIVSGGTGPIRGLTLSVDGREIALQRRGRFRAEVRTGKHMLRVSADDHAMLQRSVRVEKGRTVTLELSLIPEQAFAVKSFAAHSRFRQKGALVSLPPNSVVDEAGRPAKSGTLHLAVLNPQGADLRSMPGRFAGVTASGKVVAFESAGAARLSLSDGKRVLQIRKGAHIRLLLPLPAVYAKRKSVPLWHFDEQSGTWKEEGLAHVVRVGGRRFIDARLPHLSWWNADFPYEGKTTIWVKSIVSESGREVAARVMARGINYMGASWPGAYSETPFPGRGTCVEVKPNSRVEWTAEIGGSGISREFRTPKGPSSCQSNYQNGLVVERLQLHRMPGWCVRGRVQLGNNFTPLTVRFHDWPYENEDVDIQKDGSFCADLPHAGKRRGWLTVMLGYPSPLASMPADTLLFAEAAEVRGALNENSCTQDEGRGCLDVGLIPIRKKPFDHSCPKRWDAARITMRNGAIHRGTPVARSQDWLYACGKNGYFRLPLAEVAFHEYRFP